METNHRLKEKTVTDLVVHINPEIKKIELNINASIVFGKPVEEENKSGMVRPTLTLQAEDPESFHVSITEILIYEFDNRPEDVEATLRELYSKEGVNIISDDLDKILIDIGKAPITIKQYF